LLKKYGIESTDEVALTQAVSDGVPLGRPIDPFRILAAPPSKSDNVLAKQFFDTLIQLRTVRVIRPALGGKFRAEPVFTTIPRSALARSILYSSAPSNGWPSTQAWKASRAWSARSQSPAKPSRCPASMPRTTSRTST